jgi:hypothetical protein
MPRRVRGSSEARGYGTAHRRMKDAYRPMVAVGGFPCVLCGRPIDPREEWHLAHNDDRTRWLGPSHKRCNLREAGLKAARMQGASRAPVTSQVW